MSDATRRTILVFGATGAQGGPVAQRLLTNGNRVRVLERDPGRADEWRAVGAEVVRGDLDDRASLDRATDGVDAVFLHLPQVHDDRLDRFGRNAIDAAAAAGVRHLVFNSSSIVPVERTDVPIIERKREIEDYLGSSGVPAIRLRPNSYMDNLLGSWTKPAVVGGVVAHPAGDEARLAWIAQADVAAMTVAALGRPDLAGRAFTAAGPEALRGEEIAAHFTRAFRRPVRYQVIPHDLFEQQLAGALGPDAAREIARFYRWQAARPAEASEMATTGEDAASELGVRLTTFAEWIAKQDWTVKEAA